LAGISIVHNKEYLDPTANIFNDLNYDGGEQLPLSDRLRIGAFKLLRYLVSNYF